MGNNVYEENTVPIPPPGSNRGAFVERWFANIEAQGGSPRKTLVGFVVAWVAFFAILNFFPLIEFTGMDGEVYALSPAARGALAVMVAVSIMWVTEAVPVGITGILIPVLLVMTGAVEAFPQAARGFTTPVVFLCLGAFLFAAIMQAALLDKRLAAYLMSKAKVKDAGGVIWSFLGVNLVLSLIIPAANARAATMLPVINGVCALFGDSEQEQNAKKAIVIQSLVYGSMISGMAILTAHLPNMVILGLFQQELGLNISYIQWFTLQWPYLGMFVITQWWVRYHFKTAGVGIPGGLERVKQMSKELPPTQGQDWIIVGVFAFVGLLWVTEPWHGITTWQAIIIGVAVMFIPGMFTFKWKLLQDKTIWGTWLLLAGALSLSGAMASTGLAVWLAELIHPVAAGHPWWLAIFIMMVGTHIIRLGMLSNVAAITLLAPILLALAPRLDLHPVAFTLLVADTDTFAYLLPTQITAAVIAYSSGTFSMTDYFKVGWVAVVIAIFYGILVLAPWYAFMGIPVWDPSAAWPFGYVN